MTMVKKDAGKILQTYLNEHGIKQTFVANKMGISNSNFNDRMRGRLKFDADFALAVAKALKIDAHIFLK